MGKSILDIERGLRLHHAPSGPTRPGRAPVKRYDKARCAARPGGTPLAVRRPANGAAAAMSARPRARARAFDAIDVAVDGLVAPLQQRNAMTCWATVYTMLVNWKNQRSEPVESAIAAVGPRWSAILAQGDTRGLRAAEKVDFLADAGLVALPPQNPMIERWAQMLKTYGPLWVTTDEAPPNLMIHARVLLSMRGDGTADGTTLTLINPGSGGTDVESFTVFLAKFEAEAANPRGTLRVQIVHWPLGARAFSLARETQAIVPPPLLFAGTARAALMSALTTHGVSPPDAERLVSAFEAEVMGSTGRPIPLSRHSNALDVPDGDPSLKTETARQILQFFYQRSFPTINGDHARLAARIVYDAARMQELSGVPSTPPSSWFDNLMIRTLWLRVEPQISADIRRKVADHWSLTLDQIEHGLLPLALDAPAEEPSVTAERARQILKFFFPNLNLGEITEDHRRVAALMIHEAWKAEKALKTVPGVPKSRPGAAWLAKEAAKILWNAVKGPSGISEKVRSRLEINFKSAIRIFEVDAAAQSLSRHPFALSYVEQQGLSDWINNPDIPLSPAVGGRSLDHAALEIGDLIVSTTTEAPSVAIRRIGSPVSHVMLYVGGGRVVEAVGEGVVDRPLADALAHSFVGVAFRHPSLTPDQALMARDFVGQRIGAAYDYDLIVAHARFELGRMVCDQLPESLRDRCRTMVGPVDIGRGADGRFICSSLVAEAFEAAGVPLLPEPARSANPGDIALRANLIYLGHVKYDPPAGLGDRLRRL